MPAVVPQTTKIAQDRVLPPALQSIETPKGSQDFGIHPITGNSTKATGPAVLPPDAKVTQQFTAVKMRPEFVPLRDTGLVTATITGVEDGDTAYGRTKEGRSLTVRLAGIDAPETDHPKAGKKGQSYGQESKRSLEEMILNHEVEVVVTQANDKNGRSIGQITLKGKNINREQLVKGAAWVNKRYNQNPEDIAAFDNAQKLKMGLFGEKGMMNLWADPVPPWEHRKTK